MANDFVVSQKTADNMLKEKTTDDDILDDLIDDEFIKSLKAASKERSAFIRDVAKRCAVQAGKKLGLNKVILFGSAARGTATRDSDMDLIVVWDTTLRFSDRVGRLLPYFSEFDGDIDIFPLTPEEFELWGKRAPSNKEKVLNEGVVLYER